MPGPAAAAVVLLAGFVLASWLPASVLTVPVWDAAAEQIAILLAVSAALLVRATRDPAAGGRHLAAVRSGGSRRAQ